MTYAKLGAAVLFGFATLLSPAAAQEVTWRATTIYPEASNSGAAFEAMAAKLAEASGGRMELQLNPGGALGFSNGDNFEIVGTGVIEVAETLTGALVGVNPLFGATSLPFLVSGDADTQAMMVAVTPTFDAIFEGSDQLMLGWGAFPAVGVFADRPIATTGDFANLKLRTFDSFSAEAMQTLGATPVQLPFSEAVTALSSGVVDGLLTSTEGGKVISIWDLGISDFTQIVYSTPVTVLHINRSAFEGLDADLQAAVLAAGDAFTQTHWNEGRERVAENLTLLSENGVAVHESVSAELQAAFEQIRSETAASWAQENGPDAAALLTTINAALAE
ncbi:MAG: TRAP transporter substrate-binding protein DctP [Pseudomonadota bacterium]